MVYGFFVLYVALAFDRKWLPTTGVTTEVIPDFEEFNIPPITPQTLLLRFLSDLLTPRNYILCLRRVTQKLQSITGINRRGFLKNIGVMFIFYYLVVSAPAAAMIPINYSVEYTLQSIVALLAMMLTNAIGDYFSIKLTIGNVKRIVRYHRRSLVKNGEPTSFTKSLKTEAILYAITIFDMLIAFGILVVVLLLTSLYFGVSIGEYQFEFTHTAIEGAKERLGLFWTTAMEPYWFRDTVLPDNASGLPMLFIFSVTSFVPSVLILVFALFWT
ncbi:MAG: hypothetical protein COB78_07130 [Hyphomicrobiales bacterium]|nr:MAG: hypothetical protein COB78_07130 [Hyphomicrobiales bacterium]